MDNEQEVIMPEPEYSAEPQEVVIEEKPKHKDELADLFEVPQPEDNDMVTDHLLEVDEEEGVDDLLDVTPEDVIGEAPPPKLAPKTRSVVRYRRTSREYPPPASMGGINA